MVSERIIKKIMKRNIVQLVVASLIITLISPICTIKALANTVNLNSFSQIIYNYDGTAYVETETPIYTVVVTGLGWATINGKEYYCIRWSANNGDSFSREFRFLMESINEQAFSSPDDVFTIDSSGTRIDNGYVGVASNESKNGLITCFSKKTLAKYGISDVKRIKVNVEVYYFESDGIFTQDNYCHRYIYPEGESNYTTVISYPTNSIIIYNTDGAQIRIIGIERKKTLEDADNYVNVDEADEDESDEDEPDLPSYVELETTYLKITVQKTRYSTRYGQISIKKINGNSLGDDTIREKFSISANDEILNMSFEIPNDYLIGENGILKTVEGRIGPDETYDYSFWFSSYEEYIDYLDGDFYVTEEKAFNVNVSNVPIHNSYFIDGDEVSETQYNQFYNNQFAANSTDDDSEDTNHTPAQDPNSQSSTGGSGDNNTSGNVTNGETQPATGNSDSQSNNPAQPNQNSSDNASTQNSTDSTSGDTVVEGEKISASSGISAVTNADGSVTITKTKNKKNVKIGANVDSDGKTYPVQSIKAKAITGKKIKNVTINAENLKSVSPNMFKGATNLKKVIIIGAKKGSSIAKKIVKAAKKVNKNVIIVYK